jgi:hypothetical protein
MKGGLNKDLKLIQGEGWLQSWLRRNQERTIFFENNLAHLADSLPSHHEGDRKRKV